MGFLADDLTPKRPATATTPFMDFSSDNEGNADPKSVTAPQGNDNTISDSMVQHQKDVENAFQSGLVEEPAKHEPATSVAQAVSAPSPESTNTPSLVQHPGEVTPNQGIQIDWTKPYSEIEQNPILRQMKPYDIVRDFQKNGNGDYASFMPWLQSLGDADKTVAANEALRKKAERQAKWEQWGNLFQHIGNFFGTAIGAPEQKIESAEALTERQRKLREGTEALRQKGYDQMMVNIFKERQDKQAQMQAETAAKAKEAQADYYSSQKKQVDALTPAKVEEVNQSARQHSTGADLNVSKKETEDALRGKKGKLLDAQANNANAGADDKRSHIGVNNSTIAKNNAQTQKTNRENAENKEADDFNYNYVNDPVFKKHVNEWATHNGMAIGGNATGEDAGRGGTWANKNNRQQASAYAKARMAKEGKKRTVRPYGGKPGKGTSGTKVDYSKYIRK